MLGSGHLQLTETAPGGMSVIAALNANLQAIDEGNPWARAGMTAGEALVDRDLVRFGADGKLYQADGTGPVVGRVDGGAAADGEVRLIVQGVVPHTHAEVPGTVAYEDTVTQGLVTASTGGAKVGVFAPGNTLFLFPMAGW